MEIAVINRSYIEVFDNIIRILRRKGFAIKEGNQRRGYITANKKSSFMSYGETIEITFRNLGRATEVSINSYAKGIQIFDWGVNKENERIIKKALREVLT
jgi:hypothetical protein